MTQPEESVSISTEAFFNKLFEHAEKLAVLTSNQDKLSEVVHRMTQDIMNNFSQMASKLQYLEQRLGMNQAGVPGGKAQGLNLVPKTEDQN